MSVIGWDIGGVNTKVARVENGNVRAVRSHSFELQRAPDSLVALLRALAVEIDASPKTRHAVTMTAELSQMFRTKRDGVAFVLDAVEAAFPGCDIHVFTVGGTFVAREQAVRDPLSVAAANWAATATMVADSYRDGLLIDIGTTTTDVIPIVAGRVVASGRTDPDRLASGELVYTGAVRTPIEAITKEVPLRGGRARVSAESFALVGDVHVWRGTLAPETYSAPTPDGRPVTREFVGERLARVVCADREMLDDEAVSAIADAVAGAQLATVAGAIREVLARHGSLRRAIVTGVGDFIAAEAAAAVGLDVVHLAKALGDAAARCAPAAAVALLREASTRPIVDLVVKIGGGLLAFPDHLERTLRVVTTASRQGRILIVPGGGPFADTVREIDRRVELSAQASHWMAVLAMDQYAHLLVSRTPDAILADDVEEIAAAVTAGRLPVLAPSRWLRRADPLPHTWDATSDSIAAWVAGAIGASRLVLIKPPGANGTNLVDPYFAGVVDREIEVSIVTADQIDAFDFAASIRLRATVR